uniref:GATA zinc finger domain-containing protein 1 n=1 Tax=Ciona intestinalis TaxID=7719 RepID=H2XZF3_CIOIN
MPFGAAPVCKHCSAEETPIWRREGNEFICQTCFVKQGINKREKTGETSNGNGSKKSNGKGKNSRSKIARNKTVSKGKGRRSIFKNKFFSKRLTPTLSGTSVVTDSVFYKGQYYQTGDIVSVIDEDDCLPYYAQCNGFLTDEYSEKYTSFTWLIPSKKLDQDRSFDPKNFYFGPSDDTLHLMDAVEFVCHAPTDYFKPSKSIFNTYPSRVDKNYISVDFALSDTETA